MLSARLERLGFSCETLQYSDVTNLWCRRGDEGPLFVFAGHTDVVPTGPLDDWSHPPFDAVTRDGTLFGRGAADMKGSLAAMVTATEAFLKRNPNHQGSIGFLITSDEEGPAVHGTREVMKELTRRGTEINWCLVGEPSSREVLGDTIKIGRRGSLSGHLRIQGKQGHVAYPDDALNPIHLCAPLIQDLTGETWDEGSSEFPPTSFQISNINSGTGAGNVIPGHADIEFNLRFSPQVTADQIQTRIENLCYERGLNYSLDWTLFGQPFITAHGKLVEATQESIAQVVGVAAEPSTSGGTSDGRFIAPYGGEVVELGPINRTIHRIDEQVSINDLEDLSRIYADILGRLVGTLATTRTAESFSSINED